MSESYEAGGVVCPCCGNTCKVPLNTLLNIEQYHDPKVTVTACCGKLVRLVPRLFIRAEPYVGDKKVDDWGREPKK